MAAYDSELLQVINTSDNRLGPFRFSNMVVVVVVVLLVVNCECNECGGAGGDKFFVVVLRCKHVPEQLVSEVEATKTRYGLQ